MVAGVQCYASLAGDLCHCFAEPGAGVGVHCCASLLREWRWGSRTDYLIGHVPGRPL